MRSISWEDTAFSVVIKACILFTLINHIYQSFVLIGQKLQASKNYNQNTRVVTQLFYKFDNILFYYSFIVEG